MRRIFSIATMFVLCTALLCLAPDSQDIQHDAVAVNIEVPVRVFKGDTVVDNLTIRDFELYEDGELQNIEAVYLISKDDITREELTESKRFYPLLNRNFVLMLEIWEYLPKVEEAIDFFFDHVILPEDTLYVVTPRTTYKFKEESFEKLRKDEIAKQLKGTLRTDTQMGNAEYRSLFHELEASLVGDLGDIALDLQRYSNTLHMMDSLRYIAEKKLMDFADYLKQMEGQKIVFMIYQKEVVPEMSPERISNLVLNNQNRPDIGFTLGEIFEFYRRDVTFDVEKIRRVYADSLISIHFLYLSRTPTFGKDFVSQMLSGIRYEERSEDIFSAFSKIAQATGGLVESSGNAFAGFQKAVEASENYYILYYTPKNYRSDGKFRKIKVTVKGKDYKVLHRAGYLAD